MDSMNIPPNVVKSINHDSVTINGGTYEQPLIMPNIHQITRQRLQSADFAQKPGLVQRIPSILKKV